ncbi:MAG: hypothetical protein V5A52_02575 [Halovenus sp.]
MSSVVNRRLASLSLLFAALCGFVAGVIDRVDANLAMYCRSKSRR